MIISQPTRRALCAMLVFTAALASAPAFRPFGAAYATFLWKLFWIGFCFLGLAAAYRMRPSEALQELGFKGPIALGLTFGLVTSLPLLAVLAFTYPLNPDLEVVPLFSTGILAPITEELLFRGYLFWQLYRRAGWPFASAVITSAVLFGLAHLGTLVAEGKAVSVAGEVGMIAAGGAFFAWLLVRWKHNLWVPIATHAFMNLSCELYGCDARPGTWGINLGRLLTVAAAVGITLAYQHRQTGGEGDHR
jgi:membrane protease YdiL (CAAX protease family)